MKKEQCKICQQIIELEDDDRIKVCYGEGHITLKQWEFKRKRGKDEEKNESQ